MTAWLLFLGLSMHQNVLQSGCKVIENDRIYGENLAKIVPVFAGKLPGDLVVGFSPKPGTRLTLTSAELQRIGAPYGISVPPDTQACFEWRMQTLTAESVTAALRESLGPGVHIDVLAFSTTQAPGGKINFPLSGLLASTMTGPDTPVTWRGSVTYNGSRRFEIWARLKISATMTRVVATKLILPGENVAAEQVRLETYDDFPLRNDIARNLEEVIGRMPRRAIRAGMPVFRADLAEPLQVRRGDMVQVTAISGAAELHMPALAETPGRQGDMISLRNPSTGKMFRARIEGKDKALVIQ